MIYGSEGGKESTARGGNLLELLERVVGTEKHLMIYIPRAERSFLYTGEFNTYTREEFNLLRNSIRRLCFILSFFLFFGKNLFVLRFSEIFDGEKRRRRRRKKTRFHYKFVILFRTLKISRTARSSQTILHSVLYWGKRDLHAAAAEAAVVEGGSLI